MSNRFTEGLNQVSDGRYRIYEDVYVSRENLTKIPIKEGTLIETAEGSKDLVTSYRMNVWEVGKKNRNKRCYDRVIEQVLENNAITIGLKNHPEGNSDGDPGDTFAVESNPKIENGWLTCQVDLVGEYGRLVEDILDKGAPICISSSCLGRVDESGYIEPSGFFLERYGDWILNPSNGYYHYKSEMVESTKTQKESVEESTNQKSTILVEENIETDTENISNKKEEIKENNKTMTNEIRNLRLNLKNMIREADKSSDTNEKLELFEEALNYCEGEELQDLKESITSKVEAINESIVARAKEADLLEATVKEKETEVSEVQESVKEQETVVSKLKAITEAMKSDFNRTRVLLEKQTELREESEAKVVILERDLAEVLEKTSLLEADLDKALGLTISEADDKDKEKDAEDKKADDKEMSDEEKDTKSKAKDDEKEADGEEEKEVEEKGKKKKESVSDINPKVRSYYIDSVGGNAKLKENKDEILACETLEEAQALVLKLANGVETVKEKAETVQEENKAMKQEDTSISSITEKFRNKWNF